MSLNLKQTFGKNERIFLKKEIHCLFKNGSYLNIYPLRIIYLEKQIKGIVPISILVSVSKKCLKHAVERNRMKRLIRESYRLAKNKLWNYFFIKNRSLLLAIIYTSHKLHSCDQIKMVINKSLNTLIEKEL